MDWRLKTLTAVIFMLAAIAVACSRLEGSHPLLQRTSEDPVALFTALLTVFTGLLFFATCGLWYMAVRQSSDTQASIAIARNAADAAKRSADLAEAALVGAEAPFIFVTVEHIPPHKSGKRDGSDGFAKVKFHNHGRSPAIIRDFYPGAIQSMSIPEPISYPPPHSALHYDEIIPAKGEGRQHIIAGGAFYRAQEKDVDPFDPDLTYWIVGQIRYADAFGAQYVTGFCFALNNFAENFYGIGGSAYNYRRRLSEAEKREAEASDAELPIRRSQMTL